MNHVGPVLSVKRPPSPKIAFSFARASPGSHGQESLTLEHFFKRPQRVAFGLWRIGVDRGRSPNDPPYWKYRVCLAGAWFWSLILDWEIRPPLGAKAKDVVDHNPAAVDRATKSDSVVFTTQSQKTHIALTRVKTWCFALGLDVEVPFSLERVAVNNGAMLKQEDPGLRQLFRCRNHCQGSVDLNLL